MAGPIEALIAGTQKGGTTALFRFLSAHPQILTPPAAKELHFFDDDAAFSESRVDYAGYEGRFPPARDGLVRLEATPIYMYWPPCAARMARYNSRFKLVLILRDPVERAVSQWRMEYARGSERLLFEDAVGDELAHPGRHHRVRSYLARGLYGEQVQRLRQYFGPDQILVVTRQLLLERQRRTLDEVCRFLAIPAFTGHPEARMHYPEPKRDDLPPVDPEFLRSLRGHFAADAKLLASLCHVELGWERPPGCPG
jgi:hypothetical protein